ncbi:Na+/H+ antiporter subunit E [Corynebacterium poyangense]|uniref:Na+/H+ antiporter subunit E n=1 Tax=Corynebacterium poyangense TaxID=2684405 RepID=UPI00165D2527|nr:Na+/H+ antiporter subunit E [Corynebacterium poyangense]
MMSGIKRRFQPWTVLFLTAMWILLMGQLTWGNLLAGLGIALIVVLGLPLPAMPLEGITINWGAIVRLVFHWWVNLFHASIQVAWLALRPHAPPPTAIVRAPMRVQSDAILALAAMMYNLQPGGAITDIDIANRMLTIHLLDARNIPRELARVEKLEQSLIRSFERV